MKTAIKKTKMITIGLVAIFLMGFTPVTFSNDPKQTPVEIKAIGEPNKQPLFELKMNNAEENEFLVRLKDGNGDLLYVETIKGKNVIRRYQLDVNGEEFNTIKLRFEITMLKTNETLVYNITRNMRVVEDIVVAKL
jgi:hypothetical protein